MVIFAVEAGIVCLVFYNGIAINATEYVDKFFNPGKMASERLAGKRGYFGQFYPPEYPKLSGGQLP
jgi:hypothetical protein